MTKFPDVHQDSLIQSLDDLTSDTIIALADFNNASGFYMPVYDLYGRTLRVDLNNTTEAGIEKVRSGAVDLAAGISVIASKVPDLRIIHVSRPLPTSGVYLSPNLSKKERKLMTKILFDTPTQLMEEARFGRGQAVDFSEFRNIVQRVEAVTHCTNWDAAKVKLFCQEIVGTLQGYRSYDDVLHFNLKTSDGKQYRLVLPRAVMNQDPNLDSPSKLNFQQVAIQNVEPILKDGVLELDITAPGQLSLL